MKARGQRNDFCSLLASTGHSPDIPESADVYGWLCGSWDLDVRCYRGVNVPGQGDLQEGKRPDGTRTRWTFTEITEKSFHWRGEALYPGKPTWTLELLATRR